MIYLYLINFILLVLFQVQSYPTECVFSFNACLETYNLLLQLYLKCGQFEHSAGILEEYLKGHPSEADLSVLDLLLSILMQNNAHEKALHHIEHAHRVYFSGKELPLKLKVKSGICYLCLGYTEKAEVYCINLFTLLIDFLYLTHLVKAHN